MLINLLVGVLNADIDPFIRYVFIRWRVGGVFSRIQTTGFVGPSETVTLPFRDACSDVIKI